MNIKWQKSRIPVLTNMTATMLNLLGYEKVEEYDDSLISFTK